MKIEDIVVDLEIAKKLKEAGWEQNNLFYIDENNDAYTFYEANDITEENEYYKETRDSVLLYSAPTADEIIKKLPRKFRDATLDMVTVHSEENEIEWQVGYGIDGLSRFYWFCYDEKLSNALAKIWLWCKKNGYLEEEK